MDAGDPIDDAAGKNRRALFLIGSLVLLQGMILVVVFLWL